MPRTFVAYMRVSTDKQGRSGLGLEAQQSAISTLAGALERCRKTGSTLLVAKLDRLSRNVVFLRTLIDSGVDVAFCDLPEVPTGAMGRFLLTQMAAVAELEAGLTSERTKAALAAARARGVKLGGDRGYRSPNPPDWKAGARRSADLRAQTADQSAHKLAPTIEAIRADGAASLKGIARELTRRAIPTGRGELMQRLFGRGKLLRSPWRGRDGAVRARQVLKPQALTLPPIALTAWQAKDTAPTAT